MIKRVLDIFISFFVLLVSAPILLTFMFLIWKHDNKSPFYIAPRVGKKGKLFYMIKLRSMIVNADKIGIDSTSNDDDRIIPIGKTIRKYKLDEITQLWNVLLGDMSLVGPRPNVIAETNLYTNDEKNLLTTRPGITDFSSIVFSDEGTILENKKDPDLAYNQLIRPWKSRLGLIYIKHQSIFIDLSIMFYTVVSLVSRQKSLNWVSKKLYELGEGEEIAIISKREIELQPHPPPGSNSIVSKNT